MTDELRFNQIMINIIGNAIKYTPEGKEIFVTAEESDSPLPEKRRYVFTVRDTGIGMKAEFLPHIFESFSRERSVLTDKVQGTGLGMAITAKLVQLMGGEIAVKSKENEGSEFTVTLDLAVINEAYVIPDGFRGLVLGRDKKENETLAALIGETGIGCDVADNFDDAEKAASSDVYDFIIFNNCADEDMRCAMKLSSSIGSRAKSLIKIVDRIVDRHEYADKDFVTHFLEKPVFRSDLLSVLEADGCGKNEETFEKGDFSGCKALLVEDNDINAAIADFILKERGFAVDRAENGKKGVDMIAEAGAGGYSVVLMDIQMPVMNGYEAAREIRKLGGYFAEVPIIAMSANAFDEDVRNALGAGMNDHVSKPIDVERLFALLKKYVKR